MKKEQEFHGSDLERVEAVYGIKKEEIVNFAANVNPLGISPLMKQYLSENIDVITSYPDRDYKKLRQSIGEYCKINPANIVVGNGSTELISITTQFLQPKKALIVAPTYSEYERELTLTGASVDYFKLQEDKDFVLEINELKEALKQHYDLLVICNPNNPTSTALSNTSMSQIFDLCRDSNSFVMVDETYMEFAPNMENYTCVTLSNSYDNFICLRGVSKFYAAPGLRLGYAITANQTLLATIHAKQNPWSVSSLAEAAGIVMYQDTDFQNRTASLMHQEQKRIYDIFSKSDRFKPYYPYGNFILLKILDDSLTSGDLFEKALKKGYMIRNCSSFPYLDNRFIRFCFMNPEDNDKLIELLLS